MVPVDRVIFGEQREIDALMGLAAQAGLGVEMREADEPTSYTVAEILEQVRLALSNRRRDVIERKLQRARNGLALSGFSQDTDTVSRDWWESHQEVIMDKQRFGDTTYLLQEVFEGLFPRPQKEILPSTLPVANFSNALEKALRDTHEERSTSDRIYNEILLILRDNGFLLEDKRVIVMVRIENAWKAGQLEVFFGEHTRLVSRTLRNIREAYELR